MWQLDEMEGTEGYFLYSPAATSQFLHPFNIARLLSSVLRHTLKSVSPALLVVRRVRSSSRQHHHSGGTLSETSRRTSRRPSSATSSVEGYYLNESRDTDASVVSESARSITRIADGSIPRYAHRRHRGSDGGTRISKSAMAEVAGGSSQRSRSAELLPASLRKQNGGDVHHQRRSHSYESRSRHHVRREREGKRTSQGLSDTPRTGMQSRNSSFGSNAVVGVAMREVGRLLPPPPVIGKPPLSGRRPSSAAAPGASTSARSSRRGSAAELSSSRRGSSGDGQERTSRHRSRTRKPEKAGIGTSKGWWRHLRHSLRRWDVTAPAYLLAHLLRAVPVSCVHMSCEVQRQVAALPLLRFRDEGTNGRQVLQPWAAAVLATAEEKTPEFGSCAESTPYGLPSSWVAAQFVATHVVLRTASHYVEGAYFLDETLIVRNLRSRRFSRRLLGWGMRITSHAVLDPALLSVVATLICLSVRDLAPCAGPLRYTVPGFLRGMMCSFVSVWLRYIATRTSHWLVNRGIVTVFDFMEYLLTRRYRTEWPEDDEDPEDTGSEDDETGKNDDWASRGSRRTVAGQGPTPASSLNVTSDDEHGTAVLTAVQQVEEEQRRQAREKRRRRKRRQVRRELIATRARQALLRAIAYRVVASLVANCVVQHPMGVAVELIRGRALMHITGLLQPYEEATSQDIISIDSIKRFFREAVNPPHATDGVTEAEPPIVRLPRKIGKDIAYEADILTASVRDASGQAPAIMELRARVDTDGYVPSARESAELLARSVMAFSPLYYGVQYTALDELLSFYMAVWTRLTRH